MRSKTAITRDITATKHRRAADKERLVKLREELAKADAYPPPPPSTRISFSVRFKPYGKVYEYLALRTGDAWYTTGLGSQACFPSWEALVNWLRNDDIDWVGPIYPLGTSRTERLTNVR